MEIMVNEVEETIRVIRQDMEVHELKLEELNKTREYINNSDIPVNHRNIVLEALEFSMAYHNHKMSRLDEYREEVMKKYGLIS